MDYEEKRDVGLIGLAVMGENLALNMESKGYKVAVYNRTAARVDNFINGRAKGKDITGCYSIEELITCLASPRKVILMVKAGKPVDDLIEQLIPYLDEGDIIIDGGNSHFCDTERRTKEIEARGLRFIGTGISGGEEGALKGPSIMPGGSYSAWSHVKDIFQSIAAKAGKDNAPCCDWIGRGGAGHYVKMVHNGIEYSDMELISEAYFLLKNLMYKGPEEMADIFEQWNKGPLNSYLIEITVDILRKKDPETGNFLVEMILDKARQKGTGMWTSQSALELGVPVPDIASAVFSRYLSSMKDERKVASKGLSGPDLRCVSSKKGLLEAIRDALYASKIVSYAQGFSLLKRASSEYGWEIDLSKVALMWRGGCIIRAALLDDISDAFTQNPDLSNILIAPKFSETLKGLQSTWRHAVTEAIKQGIPVPGLCSALSYYDGYRSANLPANLIQAQRDYFGAHTYERVDRAGICHTKWV
jgi:6-phosphogluconate dehydrogenase